jgi:hypothetical protein
LVILREPRWALDFSPRWVSARAGFQPVLGFSPRWVSAPFTACGRRIERSEGYFGSLMDIQSYRINLYAGSFGQIKYTLNGLE